MEWECTLGQNSCLEACQKIFKGILPPLKALRGISFSCFLLQIEETKCLKFKGMECTGDRQEYHTDRTFHIIRNVKYINWFISTNDKFEEEQ